MTARSQIKISVGIGLLTLILFMGFQILQDNIFFSFNNSNVDFSKVTIKRKVKNKWTQIRVRPDLVRCISMAAKDSGVDLALAFSIPYAETRFDPTARSSSNAYGLYGLKYDTAMDMANRLGWGGIAEEIKIQHKRGKMKILYEPYLSSRLGLEYYKWIKENKKKFKCRDWIDIMAKYSARSKREVEGSYIVDLKDYYYQLTGNTIAEMI